jgi:hypothetical protein
LKQPIEIGYQPEGPLTAARSIRMQDDLSQNSPWLADHDRVTIAQAIPMPALQLPR